MKITHFQEFFKNKKIVFLSIFTNAIAITLSFIIGIFYTTYRKESYISEEGESNLKWYDYFVAMLLSILTALTSYFIVFIISGYLPMSRIQFV